MDITSETPTAESRGPVTFQLGEKLGNHGNVGVTQANNVNTSDASIILAGTTIEQAVALPEAAAPAAVEHAYNANPDFA